jgi:uncharacterized protein
MSYNPVTWFEIYVHDLERARLFYEQLFDYKLIPEPPHNQCEVYRFPSAMPQIGAMGALIKHPMRGPSPEGVIIYFHCDDCGTRAQKALSLGAKIFKPKMSIGKDGFIALISDSEGNIIGLHSFD